MSATLTPLRPSVASPNRALIFRWRQGTKLAGTWQFVLEPVEGNVTRLILRAHARNTGFMERYIWGYGMGPISFFKGNAMLQGIKERPEQVKADTAEKRNVS